MQCVYFRKCSIPVGMNSCCDNRFPVMHKVGIFYLLNFENEMVSTGDTSTMELGRGGTGGTPDQLKPKVPRSVQIWLFGEGGGTQDQLKIKVPRSVQIRIFGDRWWWEVYSRPIQIQNAKVCPNLKFLEGAILSRPIQTQSAKIWPNYHWGGGHSWPFEQKISRSLACLFITDSLSHTTYVETNKLETLVSSLNLNVMNHYNFKAMKHLTEMATISN